MAPGPAASGPHLTRAAFELIVDEALDAIPSRLLDLLDNVAIMVEDEPPDEPDLLGLYDGTPLTERDSWWGAGSLPDRILIFQGPLERMCSDLEEPATRSPSPSSTRSPTTSASTTTGCTSSAGSRHWAVTRQGTWLRRR